MTQKVSFFFCRHTFLSTVFSSTVDLGVSDTPLEPTSTCAFSLFHWYGFAISRQTATVELLLLLIGISVYWRYLALVFKVPFQQSVIQLLQIRTPMVYFRNANLSTLNVVVVHETVALSVLDRHCSPYRPVIHAPTKLHCNKRISRWKHWRLTSFTLATRCH